MGIRLLAWRRRGRLGRWWVRACVSGVSVGASRRDRRAACRSPEGRWCWVDGADRMVGGDGGTRWERWSGCRCCPALSHLGRDRDV